MLTLFTVGDFVTESDFTLPIRGKREYNFNHLRPMDADKFISRSCARERRTGEGGGGGEQLHNLHVYTWLSNVYSE